MTSLRPPRLARPAAANYQVVGNTATFSWAPLNDPDGGVSGYDVIVGTTPGGSDVFSGIVTGTTLTVTNNYGATLYAEVSAINNAGIQGSFSASSSGVVLVDPAWIPVIHMANASVLDWTSVSGKVYQVWSTTNLLVPFIALGSVITAADSTTSYTNNATGSGRYYRVQLLP